MLKHEVLYIKGVFIKKKISKNTIFQFFSKIILTKGLYFFDFYYKIAVYGEIIWLGAKLHNILFAPKLAAASGARQQIRMKKCFRYRRYAKNLIFQQNFTFLSFIKHF